MTDFQDESGTRCHGCKAKAPEVLAFWQLGRMPSKVTAPGNVKVQALALCDGCAGLLAARAARLHLTAGVFQIFPIDEVPPSTFPSTAAAKLIEGA